MLEELDAAVIAIVRRTQQEAFQLDLRQLKTAGAVRKNSQLSSLDPFIDCNDVLRVGGRLRHSFLTEGQKHPIILPTKHHVTKLIIRDEHLRNLHMGPQNLLYIIRNKYWPIHGRRTVQSVLHHCKTCFRVSPRSVSIKMGDLPPARVQPTRPFQCVVLDYAGPVQVKQSSRRNA